MLRLYTQIQQVRFGDRLRVRWEIADEVLNASVPHMLLQPLVENAIKHGLEVHSEAGRVLVRADRKEDMLRLVVRDDGPGLATPSPARGAGVGIANIRNRLSQLYPACHALVFRDADGGGTEVSIEIPFSVCVSDRDWTSRPPRSTGKATIPLDVVAASPARGRPIETRL
jgi:LytS/YehU family sensor histidine kinase